MARVLGRPVSVCGSICKIDLCLDIFGPYNCWENLFCQKKMSKTSRSQIPDIFSVPRFQICWASIPRFQIFWASIPWFQMLIHPPPPPPHYTSSFATTICSTQYLCPTPSYSQTTTHTIAPLVYNFIEQNSYSLNRSTTSIMLQHTGLSAKYMHLYCTCTCVSLLKARPMSHRRKTDETDNVISLTSRLLYNVFSFWPQHTYMYV